MGRKDSITSENKLKVLPVQYKLDHVSFVNSFFINEKKL